MVALLINNRSTICPQNSLFSVPIRSRSIFNMSNIFSTDTHLLTGILIIIGVSY